MQITTRQALINYIEFLKESGFIYAEGGSVVEGSITPTIPPQAAPSHTTTKPPEAGSPKPSPELLFQARRTPQPPPAQTAPAKPMEIPQGELTREQRIALLAEAITRAETCRACDLGSQRARLVFYDGDPMAKVMFIGEAPGFHEDQQGKPFVGAAGQMLNKMIASIGLRRDEVYICNTLKCRPPKNRDPLPAEKTACEHFLFEQIRIVRPQIIVALGAHSAHYLCKSDAPIGTLRGRWHTFMGIPVIVTYHPSFLLQKEDKPDCRKFKLFSFDDLKMLIAKYNELNPHDRREIWTKKEKTE